MNLDHQLVDKFYKGSKIIAAEILQEFAGIELTLQGKRKVIITFTQAMAIIKGK